MDLNILIRITSYNVCYTKLLRIRTESAKCALVVGAETFSRIIDWTDRATCVLFGDGAGAVIIQAQDAPA